jgi:DhnA family fructose-bisphosphate aldolase class Ia
MVTRRLRKIFKDDGRAFVVACDHAAIYGPIKGMDNIEETLKQVIAAKVDGIMAPYGLVRRYPELFAKTNLVLRIDGAASILSPKASSGSAFYSVEDALRLGAEAMCVTCFPGTEAEEDGWHTLANIIRAGHEWGIPIMAEVMPGGFEAGPEMRNKEVTKIAARIAADLGADWVKIPYVEGYEEAVETCPVPIVVLGGPTVEDPAVTLEMVSKGLACGCAGATIGRNIWQSKDTYLMASTIRGMIHDGLSLEEAIAMMK